MFIFSKFTIFSVFKIKRPTYSHTSCELKILYSSTRKTSSMVTIVLFARLHRYKNHALIEIIHRANPVERKCTLRCGSSNYLCIMRDKKAAITYHSLRVSAIIPTRNAMKHAEECSCIHSVCRTIPATENDFIPTYEQTLKIILLKLFITTQ